MWGVRGTSVQPNCVMTSSSPHTSVRPLPCPFVIIQSVNAASFCGHFHYTDMRRLTTGIRSEIRVVKRFRLCANVYLHKPR
jgi:hypothetical protein